TGELAGGGHGVPRPELDDALLTLHPHFVGSVVSHGLLACATKERGEARCLRPRFQRLHATHYRGRHHGGGQGEDEQRDDELDEGKASEPPFGHFPVVQEDTSAFSPSPPGAPSAPSVQIS